MCRYKAARCHRCGEAITEAAISCNGQTYHRACYTCTVGTRVTEYHSFKRKSNHEDYGLLLVKSTD